jgi:hypothetical protein
MNNEKRNKHMTLDDRIKIQECLNKGMTFKAIAQRIEKDQTTVSKEVKPHGKVHANGFTKTDECCPKLLKAPFVCNGCPRRNQSNREIPSFNRCNARFFRCVCYGKRRGVEALLP